MTRTPLWQSIRDTLTAQIAQGAYAAGAKLPTEAALAARFGVNRHTVRHALGVMAEDGQVYARRGAGVFVTQAHTEYPIGKRVRFHQNLRAAGQVPGKDILLLETCLAGPDECSALALPDGAQVHVYEGLSYADGLPIALSRSVFPAGRLPTFLADLRETLSVTQALGRGGVADYTRTTTRLTAKAADANQALHLRIAEKAPVLHSEGINADLDGKPVEWGHTWFAGERVTLTLADP